MEVTWRGNRRQAAKRTERQEEKKPFWRNGYEVHRVWDFCRIEARAL